METGIATNNPLIAPTESVEAIFDLYSGKRIIPPDDGIIYLLCHPETRAIKYVGQTIHWKLRFKQHLYEISGEPNKNHKKDWIFRLRNNNLCFIPALYKICNRTLLNKEEKDAIYNFLGIGCRLENSQAYEGQYIRNTHPPIIASSQDETENNLDLMYRFLKFIGKSMNTTDMGECPSCRSLKFLNGNRVCKDCEEKQQKIRLETGQITNSVYKFPDYTSKQSSQNNPLTYDDVIAQIQFYKKKAEELEAKSINLLSSKIIRLRAERESNETKIGDFSRQIMELKEANRQLELEIDRLQEIQGNNAVKTNEKVINNE